MRVGGGGVSPAAVIEQPDREKLYMEKRLQYNFDWIYLGSNVGWDIATGLTKDQAKLTQIISNYMDNFKNKHGINSDARLIGLIGCKSNSQYKRKSLQ